MNLYLITAINWDGFPEVEVIRATTVTAAMEFWPYKSRYREGPDIFPIPPDGHEGVLLLSYAKQ